MKTGHHALPRHYSHLGTPIPGGNTLAGAGGVGAEKARRSLPSRDAGKGPRHLTDGNT
jgi:hypothetical protein